MKNLSLILVLIGFSFFVGCKKDKPLEKFQGTWNGSYTGEDKGTWNATIDDEGKAEGTFKSDSLSNFTFQIKGTVDNSGQFEASASGFSSSIRFTGCMSETTVSGTWENTIQNLKGTWSGSKN